MNFTKANTMKTSTKFLATAAAAVALFISTNANAQSRLGIGATVGSPTNNKQSIVYGADLTLQIKASDHLYIPLSGGYTRMNASNDATGVDAIDRDYIPVKAGAKWLFSDKGYAWFVQMEAGAALATGSYPTSSTHFLFAPGAGYSWDNGLEIGARYEGFKEDKKQKGFFGLRLAYGFKL